MALIDSEYFADMLNRLAEEFDVVLVDAPPVGMVIDAAVMASACDGVVFIVEYNRTHARDLLQCKHQMEQSGTPVLGCIVNKVRLDTLSAKKYYNKGYYKQYTYGYYRSDNKEQQK